MVKYNREKLYEHLKRWTESGLSGQEYCREHEISPTTFYSWKKAEKNLEEQTKMNTEMEPAERFVPFRNTAQGFPDQGAITIKLHDNTAVNSNSRPDKTGSDLFASTA